MNEPTTPSFSNENGIKKCTTTMRNGTKNMMGQVVGYSVIACYGILGMTVFVYMIDPNIKHGADILDNAHIIMVMTIGAFLALAKDIFNPRREITVSEVVDLVNQMNQTTINAMQNQPQQKPHSNSVMGRRQ